MFISSRLTGQAVSVVVAAVKEGSCSCVIQVLRRSTGDIMSPQRTPWLVALLCFLAGGGAGQDIRQMQYHLERFATPRHPFAAPDGREAARSYIKEQFQEYGLEVATHAFNTTLVYLGETRTVIGENVIGVSEGTSGGPLLVVGADYDTTPSQHPLEDNGAGVAAMLEVARNYMEATGPDGDFTRNNTIIFVAFDLNTKEYTSSSTGQPGAYHFVHQWLWPHLNQSLLKFGGAIILDSITKLNMDVNTQYLPPGFNKAFPEAFKRISEDSYKGDFLALITRATSQSKRLREAFTGNYMKHRKASLVRLQELMLHTGTPVNIDVIEMMNHQAHIHFWTFQPSEKLTPLPALLLTDTDKHRKGSEECPLPCSAETFLTQQRKQSLALTCSGLLHTLLDLQAERRQPGETGQVTDGASVTVTLTATWLLAVVAAMLH